MECITGNVARFELSEPCERCQAAMMTEEGLKDPEMRVLQKGKGVETSIKGHASGVTGKLTPCMNFPMHDL